MNSFSLLKSIAALVAAGLFSTAQAFTSSPLNPPSVPLAVRTPYLSAWLPQGNGVNGYGLNEKWPTHWAGSTLGWAGYITVDGICYVWMGTPAVPGSTCTQAMQLSFEYTATQSVFVFQAGQVNLTVTFLSPVEPNDFTLYSLPLSYLAMEAVSADGSPHSVQMYTDISAEWVSGDSMEAVNWTTTPSTTTNGIITHSVELQSPQLFGEFNDRIQYGSSKYSAIQGSNVTYSSGFSDVSTRGSFIANHKLNNSISTDYRAISSSWPVFAFSNDFGTNVGSRNVGWVVSVGFNRDPAIQYVVKDGVQMRSLYYLTEYDTFDDAVFFFLNNYNTASATAGKLDSAISSAASAISSDYSDIVTLSLRQAIGSTELTVGIDSDGSLNTSDVMLFMKEISSDGNVNTVDVIMPSWPVWIYLNPELGRLLLEPLFQYQETGSYPNKYSAHDIGAAYPNATGHNDGLDEAMPVEESGNMLIMALSYTQTSGDTTIVDKYSNLLNQWTQFLINDSLIPASQLSTDDFAGTLANQTNLAIKGTVGIKAMSVIEGLLGNSNQQHNYSAIASSYVPQIINFSNSSANHLELNYGNQSSWGLAYNLFADKFLNTSVFPSSVTLENDAWYSKQLQIYGIPLDSRHTYTKSDWQLWVAAATNNVTLRDDLISRVRTYVANGQNSVPFSDWYDSVTGKIALNFLARPVVGGHFAFLMEGVSNGTSVGSSISGNTTPTSAVPISSSSSGTTTNPSSASSQMEISKFVCLSLLVATLLSTLL